MVLNAKKKKHLDASLSPAVQEIAMERRFLALKPDKVAKIIQMLSLNYHAVQKKASELQSFGFK